MKRITTVVCLFLLTVASARSADATSAQDRQVISALKEVQTQQAAIAENEAKIQEKLAAIAEALRLARIYASRSGQ